MIKNLTTALLLLFSAGLYGQDDYLYIEKITLASNLSLATITVGIKAGDDRRKYKTFIISISYDKEDDKKHSFEISDLSFFSDFIKKDKELNEQFGTQADEAETKLIARWSKFNTDNNHPFDFSNKLQFSGAVYSDLFGLSEENPNGLIQTRARLSIPLFTRAFTSKSKNVYWHFFRNIVLPELTLTKIEKEKRNLPIPHYGTNGGTSDTLRRVNRFDIIQYAYLNMNLKLNILTVSTAKHSVYLDFLANNYQTAIYDSVAKAQSKIYSYGFGGNIKYWSKFNSRVNAELFISLYSSVIHTSKYAVSDGPQIKDINYKNPFNNQFKEATRIDWINTIGGQINIHDKDDSGSIFLRAQYFLNSPKHSFYKNSFYQIQLGYSKNLDDLLGVFAKKT